MEYTESLAKRGEPSVSISLNNVAIRKNSARIMESSLTSARENRNKGSHQPERGRKVIWKRKVY
jgi:hypothetical protein